MFRAFQKHFDEVTESILHEVAVEVERVLGDVKDKAATNLQEAYNKELRDEGDTLNKDAFPLNIQPEQAISQMSPLVSITESSRKSYMTASLFSERELDEIDRRQGEISVDVLIKASRGTREHPELLNVNGVTCAVKTIKLRSRRERSRKKTFTTWRALEYGGAVGGLVRVRAKTVKSFSVSKTGKARVSYGPEVVFMSRRGAWWSRRIDPGLGNISIDAKSKIYWGGSHPIGKAIKSGLGTTGGTLDKAIKSAIRRAMKQ